MPHTPKPSSLQTPQGYAFSVVSAGFRKEKDRKDLALVVSDTPAAAAGVFTLNRFCAAPVQVGRNMLKNRPQARAIMINSGQANACTGAQGHDNCLETLRLAGESLKISPAEILPASTGVIGDHLKMDAWTAAVPHLAAELGRYTAEDFAKAIMTTDAFAKLSGREVKLPGGVVRIIGMCKGAGMICPNMATMLCAVLTDAAVDAKDWQDMLSRAADKTFNRVSVDGDTSTNDTIYALANGAAGVPANAADLPLIEAGLTEVLAELAYMLVQDGEGATKVLHIEVTGAKTKADAEAVARTVGHSPLVKTAMYGADANWGRIVAAIGRSGADYEPDAISVHLGNILLFEKGEPTECDYDAVCGPLLKKSDVRIIINLNAGPAAYTFLASDLTHAYVDCNAAYRS